MILERILRLALRRFPGLSRPFVVGHKGGIVFP